MNREDLLHERLTRLEAGEPLETCLADVPDDEAGLLRLVAALHAVPYPDATAGVIAAQRARLRGVAKESKHMASSPYQKIANAIAQGRSRRISPAAFPRPLALLLAGAILLWVLAGIFGSRPTPLATDLPYQVHVPVVNSPLVAPNPQSGVLSEARGIVEIQTSDGFWKEANVGQVVTVGQRVRTGKLSSAAVLFYDGSQAHLGPTAEVSVDELDGSADGPRVVRLTQWIGESDHDVTPSSNPASRYEVRTPSGTGMAKGTKFHVLVTANLIARFNVDEGSVAVTSLNVTVVVVAGQSTIVYANQAPTPPVFRINGEGRLEQTGDVWRIGGRDFLVNMSAGTDRSTTKIIGSPQIGDWVAVDGRILPEGSYFADRIVLLHRAPENRFAFTGTADTIGDTQWTVSGRAVRVNDETGIDAGIDTGDIVEVRGVILADGALLAERIHLVDEGRLPFEFTGVVETIAGDAWTVSGISIKVDGETEIEDNLVVGDVVKVEGRILADGIWLAKSIQRAEEDEREFAFTGLVERIDPWVVSGIGFETGTETEIDEGIQVGDRVKVEGRVLADGTWLAEEIKLLDEQPPRRFEFAGRVSSMNPWVVGGITLAVDANTRIDDDIESGDLVRVRGRILPDGTLLAERIRRVHRDRGCLDSSVVVVGISGNRIQLRNGQFIDLSDEIEIRGDLKPFSVVIIRICISEDDTVVVVKIIIIFQLEPPPPPRHDGDEDEDEDDD